MESLKLAKNKFRLLIVLALAQVWFWPMWFAYVVQSGPVAVSSFFTMIAVAIWNVGAAVSMYDKVDWEETLDRARTKRKYEI
jgi:hypothetical protein